MATSGKKEKRNWWILPSIVLFTCISAIVISYSNPFRVIELKVTDQLFEIRGPLAMPDSNIVLVAISQQADEEIPYKYPWPTRLYGKLVENLNKAGARVIGIDVIFDKISSKSKNDSLFAEQLRKHENVVLAGDYKIQTDSRGAGSGSTVQSMLEPNPILRNANPNPYGLVTVFRDADDAVRRYLLSRTYRGERHLSFALEVLKQYHDWDSVEIHETRDRFRFGHYRIPKYSPNTMTINYVGARGAFPQYSFESVIDDSTILLNSEDPEFQFNSFSDPDFGLLANKVFKDKIVLVGATMEELHDFHATPFAESGNRPGYETHANALQTILGGNYIRHAKQWVNLLLLLFFASVIVVATRYLGAFWGFLFFLFQVLFITGLTLVEFLNFSYVIEYTGPVIATLVGCITTTSYDYLKEQREKQRIRGMFSSYVSPTLVEQMIESGQEPQLGGDEVYITAFFSDIQSFSAFSEKLEPHQLVELINEYLSAMTDIITDQGGTLDKYIGDAIVAFFGAPVPEEDHAYRACVSSQLMQLRLTELREKWKSEGDKWPEIVHHMRNRIGLNTGTMLTGNMGSTRRFNYTMMGDNVNLAARCESGAKSYGVYTMVTGETRKEALKHGDRCHFRYLDRIVVVGRSQPVNVYEITGLKDHLPQSTFDCVELFERGTEAYLQQNWDRAISLFKQSAELEPYQPDEDPYIKTNPSLVYLERCRNMAEHPPGDSWDGVYVMESK
ncbi:CHASE2 domain-containing protein [Halalkalibaculum sp. DA384]|uniref:CHASE2 domain-containing protein n=1 Tax=Halalkalibaculum sp. DA384 TaxID=3373606 RepID=UPI0037553987